MHKLTSCFLAVSLFLFTIHHGFAAGGKGNAKLPDLTKGDPIPEGYSHDWTLGPTGARGWMFSEGSICTAGGSEMCVPPL